MAICREFYFPSSDGSSRIHAAEWTPESGEIIGVLQIAHGVAEYGMRYAPFAEFMTEHGFAVVANDHLGHGLSAEKDADTLYFGPRDGWKHVVDDMYALRCRTKEKYPDVPYFLMGHSMGSFLTRTYLIRYPGTVDAVIIMGTGHQSPAIVTGGRAIAKAAGKRHGFKAHSPRVEALAFGAYNKAFAPNRTEVDWLSASDNNVDAYIADPLCGQRASIGLFYEMLGGIRFISTPKTSRHEPQHAHSLHLRRQGPRRRDGQGRQARIRGLPPRRRARRGAEALQGPAARDSERGLPCRGL